MNDQIEAKEILKLYDISRATLTRWMNPEWAEQRGLAPFPTPTMKDGRSKVWGQREVAAWVTNNHANLGRHPKPPEPDTGKGASVELTLGQAYEAAMRVAEEDQTDFDYGDFEERFIEPMKAALLATLGHRGVKGAVWMGDKFAFVFPEGDEGDQNAVLFKLTFS